MLGELQIFTWKNKETQQREQTEYEQWAFPYGQKQRDNLTELLLSVFPRETVPTTLIPFLTCRELYESALKGTSSRDMAIDRMVNGHKKYKRIIKKKDMATYLAVVLANAQISEECNYPTAEEIHAHAAELEKLRRDS